MRKIIFILAISIYSITSFTQNSSAKLDLNNPDHIIFHIGLSPTSQDSSPQDITYKMMQLNQVFFCKTNVDNNRCIFIAERNIDLSKLSELFSGMGFSIDFRKRERLSEEKYLQLYFEDNKPIKITSRNPEKDKHNLELAKAAKEALGAK